MTVSNSIPYIKECINNTIEICDKLTLIESNTDSEDVKNMKTIVEYLKKGHHNISLIIKRINELIQESEKCIYDKCEHVFTRDYNCSWDCYGPMPKYCTKCGISNY
jgi:hypothetical protein